ncbi:MAG: arginine--tRNA ligase [Candidatus Pristimantibacillus sp.]
MKKIVASLLSTAVPNTSKELIDKLEFPISEENGDVSFPVFSLAKTLRKSPNQIALELAEQLNASLANHASINKVVAAGGYINFFLNRAAYTLDLFSASLAQRFQPLQRSDQVVIEFSSPNIAKHFKLYHIRSTMIGAALANVYGALGYKVTKINHLGDWGTQFGKLIIAYKKWGNAEPIQQDPITELVALYVRFHEEATGNPELENLARDAFAKLENGDKASIELWEWFRAESMKEFDRIYNVLGVTFDEILGESFYSSHMDHVISSLVEKQLLIEDQDALVVPIEGKIPCLIQKSDGSSIYATRDLAAAIYRQEHHQPKRMLYVVDKRQALHFEQIFDVLRQMGEPVYDACEHVSFGIMKVDGQTGSTRQGKGLLLTEVLQDVIEAAEAVIESKNPSLPDKTEVAKAIGIGSVIFNDLKIHRDHDVDFVMQDALSFEGKTGPYVQYTNARIQSLLRKGEFNASNDMNTSVFESTIAWSLTKVIASYPQSLQTCVAKNDPSQVAKFLLDTCQAFNKFYAFERVITDDADTTQARLMLCHQASQVIVHGLSMLSMKAPNQI